MYSKGGSPIVQRLFVHVLIVDYYELMYNIRQKAPPTAATSAKALVDTEQSSHFFCEGPECRAAKCRGEGGGATTPAQHVLSKRSTRNKRRGALELGDGSLMQASRAQRQPRAQEHPRIQIAEVQDGIAEVEDVVPLEGGEGGELDEAAGKRAEEAPAAAPAETLALAAPAPKAALALAAPAPEAEAALALPLAAKRAKCSTAAGEDLSIVVGLLGDRKAEAKAKAAGGLRQKQAANHQGPPLSSIVSNFAGRRNQESFRAAAFTLLLAPCKAPKNIIDKMPYTACSFRAPRRASSGD